MMTSQMMEAPNAFVLSMDDSGLLFIPATTQAHSETDLFQLATDDITDKEPILVLDGTMIQMNHKYAEEFNWYLVATKK